MAALVSPGTKSIFDKSQKYDNFFHIYKKHYRQGPQGNCVIKFTQGSHKSGTNLCQSTSTHDITTLSHLVQPHPTLLHVTLPHIKTSTYRRCNILTIPLKGDTTPKQHNTIPPQKHIFFLFFFFSYKLFIKFL